MNVLLYSTNYPTLNGPGGIGTYTRHLAHALAGLGHDVRVVTSATDPMVGSERRPIQEGKVTLYPFHADGIPLVDRFVPGAGACIRLGSAMKSMARRHQLDIVEF